MTNETEYRRSAAETVQLAHRAPTVADRARRISRRIRRPTSLHPLVREKLDPYTELDTAPMGGRTSD